MTFTSSVRAVLYSATDVELVLFRRRAKLCEQARSGDVIFLLKTGLVKLTRHTSRRGKFICAVVGPHQFVGEESLAVNLNSYRAEAECLVDTVAYRIPHRAVRQLFGIPDFALTMHTYALESREECAHKAELLAERNVEYRILYSLASVAELVEPTEGGTYFPVPMTQMEVAELVGATRETTSTILSDLKQRKLVTLGRRMITTVHPDLLRKAADDELADSATEQA